MKALTLHQPWATLVAIGAKQIETRSWRTHYRGPLAIHAAKKSPLGAVRLAFYNPFYAALKAGGYEPFKPLPAGVVVATCRLVDCRLIVRIADWPDEPEVELGDYRPGRYMWLLEEVEKLEPPVPARGRQGVWEWKGGEL